MSSRPESDARENYTNIFKSSPKKEYVAHPHVKSASFTRSMPCPPFNKEHIRQLIGKISSSKLRA